MQVQRQDNRRYVNPPDSSVLSDTVTVLAETATTVKEAVQTTFTQLKNWVYTTASAVQDNIHRYVYPQESISDKLLKPDSKTLLSFDEGMVDIHYVQKIGL